MRMSIGIVAAVLVAAPAFADSFSGNGYFVGCQDGACTVVAAGSIMSVAGDSDPAALADLEGLEPVTAVAVEGEIVSAGDITAELRLQSVAPVADDPLEENLRYLQGDWQPNDEETPFFVRISGLEWQEHVDNEQAAAFLITPSLSCADGVEPGGMVLSLAMIGGDPAEARCWEVAYIDETTLELRDVTGGGDIVAWQRID